MTKAHSLHAAGSRVSGRRRSAALSHLRSRRALLTAAVSLAALAPAHARAQNPLDVASRARDAIIELDVARGRELLRDADAGDAEIALEQARLAIYEGECDQATQILARRDVSATGDGAHLVEIARGCARATAATVMVRDDAHGVVVRVQDDEDVALVPLLAETASRVRATLVKDLGVELPLPMRIELVRDQFTLAAMTGLPEEAARTTGTVAVAKWGRVTMISPRATGRGYAWLDTLAHELTHLALSRGTRDKAPLWLQEGVAKREETRWRAREPLDDVPSPDSIAAIGIDKGLGLPIDKLGPSIAMLPSPEQAQVAFAEVTSFIRYWAAQAGEEALPQLLLRLRDSSGSDALDRAIEAVSGADFATWDKRWRTHLASASKDVPPELAPGGAVPHQSAVSRGVRLGQLLLERGHARHATTHFRKAQELAPREASTRCFLAESLLAEKSPESRERAAAILANEADIQSRFGRYFSLRGMLHPDAAERAFRLAISLDPLDPGVACEEREPPALPNDLVRRAICEAARRVPR